MLLQMRLILKNKNKIVSMGLIPIIITLIGLHFFPNTEMLGTGFVLSIIMLIYNIVRMKDLNFFLLLGTLGIGLCFFLRLIWGYKYVPLYTITPTVEFSLLSFTFIHFTAPEIYNELVKRLGVKRCFSYRLETKVIILLSSIHLISAYIIKYFFFEWGVEHRFFILNVIPVSIYIICFIINVTGIRVAALADSQNNINIVIRIALLCNGKVLMEQKNNSYWDLPHEILVDAYENIDRYEKHVIKAVKNIVTPTEKPRLIMKYLNDCECGCKMITNLFILPIKDESEINNNSGHFISIEEVEKHPELYSKNIIREYVSLKNAAEMWKEFYSVTCK